MPILPKKIICVVEHKLFCAELLVREARKARDRIADDILNGSSYHDPRVNVHSSGAVSQTEIKGTRLAKADEIVSEAESWVRCINAVKALYADTRTGEIAEAFYFKKKLRQDIAAEMGISEKSVDRERERFVTMVAMHAIAERLIVLKE